MKYVGQCGACEGFFKLDARRKMVLHGYQRPGEGWIIGRCPGTGCDPWEISIEGAVKYLDMVEGYLDARQVHLARLTSGEIKQLSHKRRMTNEEWEASKARGERRRYSDDIVEQIGPSHPKWREEYDRLQREIEGNIERAKTTIKYLNKRIQGWKPGTLHTAEDIERRERSTKLATLSFDTKEAEWTARGPEGKAVAVGKWSTLAGILKALDKAGWTPVDAPSAELKMSDYIRSIAVQPVPKKKKIAITSKLDPVSATALMVVYEHLRPELRAEFDSKGTKWFAERLDHATDYGNNWDDRNNSLKINLNRLYWGLVAEFEHAVDWKNATPAQRQEIRKANRAYGLTHYYGGGE